MCCLSRFAVLTGQSCSRRACREEEEGRLPAHELKNITLGVRNLKRLSMTLSIRVYMRLMPAAYAPNTSCCQLAKSKMVYHEGK